MKTPKINRDGDIEFAKSVTVGVPRQVVSGNPNYDTSTGQFASGSNKEKIPVSNLGVLRQTQELQIDPEARGKRDDAVRYISRNMPQPTIKEVKEYLRDKTKRELDTHEILNILIQAERLRVSDCVDVIDGLIKTSRFRSILGQDGVQVRASKGWLKSQLQNLTDAQVYDVYRRLIARGCTEEQVAKQFIKRFSKEKSIKIQKMLGVGVEPNGQPTKEV